MGNARPTPARRRCIFCGRSDRKITGEHLLGDWLTRLAGKGDYLAIRSAEGVLRSKTEVTWRTDKVAAITIKDICEDCNRSLGPIEEGAKAALLTLLIGRTTLLSKEQQAAIALWLFKVAILYRYAAQPPRQATASELEDLYVHRRPSAGTRVWLARYAGRFGIKLISYQVGLVRASTGIDFLRRLRKRDWDAGELVTLAVGGVAAQVALYPANSPMTYGPQAALVRQGWPVVGPMEWPPPFYFDDDGLEAFSHTELLPPPGDRVGRSP
jgi:hypothetical protein